MNEVKIGMYSKDIEIALRYVRISYWMIDSYIKKQAESDNPLTKTKPNDLQKHSRKQTCGHHLHSPQERVT